MIVRAQERGIQLHFWNIFNKGRVAQLALTRLRLLLLFCKERRASVLRWPRSLHLNATPFQPTKYFPPPSPSLSQKLRQMIGLNQLCVYQVYCTLIRYASKNEIFPQKHFRNPFLPKAMAIVPRPHVYFWVVSLGARFLSDKFVLQMKSGHMAKSEEEEEERETRSLNPFLSDGWQALWDEIFTSPFCLKRK